MRGLSVVCVSLGSNIGGFFFYVLELDDDDDDDEGSDERRHDLQCFHSTVGCRSIHQATL